MNCARACNDGRGESEQNPARAHGEHQPADHAGRHAGGFQKVDRLSAKVVAMVRKAKRVRARTAAGTDLTADLNPNYRWLKTSGIITREKWGNLPGGEIFTTPGEVNGTFVIDGVVGDYLCTNLEICKARR